MKRLDGVNMDPLSKSISSGRAWGAALLGIILMWGMVPFAAAEDTDNVPELPSIEVRGLWLDHNLTMPVAVKAPAPKLPTRMTGTKVRMTFRIDKMGNARVFRSDANPFDDNERNLTAMMRSVLPNWKFTPSYNKEGQAVEVRVALPVKAVSSGRGNADHYARIILEEPVLLAVLD